MVRKIIEIIKFDKREDSIFALHEDKTKVTTHREDGSFSGMNEESYSDLFMAPKTKTLWIAVSKEVSSHGRHPTSMAYPSLELLDENFSYELGNYEIKEIEIEV